MCAALALNSLMWIVFENAGCSRGGCRDLASALLRGSCLELAVVEAYTRQIPSSKPLLVKICRGQIRLKGHNQYIPGLTSEAVLKLKPLTEILSRL